MGALADIRAVFVRSRNLLDFEHTGLALTRIYAVEHLQVEPPSPPGYVVKDSVKHFTIIKDPAPPPPPRALARRLGCSAPPHALAAPPPAPLTGCACSGPSGRTAVRIPPFLTGAPEGAPFSGSDT